MTVKEVLKQATLLTKDQLGAWLERNGFILQPISFKRAYVGEFVVKFDDVPCEESGLSSHTKYEYMNRKRVKPWKRYYLAKTLGWANGVLIQEKVNVCLGLYSHHAAECCVEAEKLAKKLKICDWFNHGRRANGQLVFFDFDSYG